MTEKKVEEFRRLVKNVPNSPWCIVLRVLPWQGKKVFDVRVFYRNSMQASKKGVRFDIEEAKWLYDSIGKLLMEEIEE